MSIASSTLIKLQQFCAYQERCHKEVRSKLLKLEVYGDRLEEVICQLIEDDFLNEERYARSYVRGKYRMNQWGKSKIISQLKSKNISSYCIEKGLEEIDMEEYESNLENLLRKQLRQYLYKTNDKYQLRKKLFQYAYTKGYEAFLINNALEDLDYSSSEEG